MQSITRLVVLAVVLLTAAPVLATSEGEPKRQALHQWIRTSGVYDGVIDAVAPALFGKPR